MTIKHRAVCPECDWTGEPKLMNGAARDADEHRDETGHGAKIERAAATDGGRVQHGDEGQHVGVRWGNKCPRCDHLERRDYGPGRYPSPDRCPECDWPMNCVDLNIIEQEPEGKNVA